MKKNIFAKIIMVSIMLTILVGSFSGCKKDEVNQTADTGQVDTPVVADTTDEPSTDDNNDLEEPLRIQEDLPSLFKEYESDFKIGVAVPMAFLSDDSVKALMLKHFNSFTAENSMKPEFMLNSGNKEEVSFLTSDLYVFYAEESGMGLRGHTLVWHDQTPSWFFRENYADDGAFVTREVMLERLDGYIGDIFDRYKDSNIYAWDVVNEAIDISTEDNMRDSIWYQFVGPDFIEKAFEIARKHSEGTNLKLFYNDYNVIADPVKRMAIFELVKGLKEKGLIDGVGLQAHINVDSPTVSDFEETIELFASIGLEVNITELDISLYTTSVNKLDGELDELLIKQAYLYKDLFDLFRKHSDVVTSVTLWGMTDDVSWLNDYPVPRTNWPLLFDKDYQAKVAFYALVDPDSLPIYTKTIGAENGTLDTNNPDDLFSFLTPSVLKKGALAFAKTYTAWDDSYFYLKTQVMDTEILDTDGVVFQLDMNNSKSTSIEADDRNITVLSNGIVHYQDAILVSTGTQDGFELYDTDDGILMVKATKDDEGYNIVVGLPIENYSLGLGDSIGFDYVVYDGDSVLHWHDTYSDEMALPSNYSKLELVAAKMATSAKPGTPVIDGQIDSIWNSANEIDINTYTANTSGATAVTKTLWDSNFLYVLTVVTDDNLQAVSAFPYEQDSVEIFIDENMERSTSYGEEDVQYRINFENMVTVNGGPSDAVYMSATTTTGTGYIVEIAIPYNDGEKVSGQAIGFDIQVNDDQGSGARDSMTNWCDLSGNGWKNTSKFGTLILE
jgi:endo-1,4-beta-xylanase